MSWILPAIMGGVSLLKTMDERDAAKDERNRQADMMKFSPWTGYTPSGNIQEPSLFNNLLQGVMTGAMLNKSMGSESDKDKVNINLGGASKSPYSFYYDYSKPLKNSIWDLDVRGLS